MFHLVAGFATVGADHIPGQQRRTAVFVICRYANFRVVVSAAIFISLFFRNMYCTYKRKIMVMITIMVDILHLRAHWWHVARPPSLARHMKHRQ
jgi:hypothetical protein